MVVELSEEQQIVIPSSLRRLPDHFSSPRQARDRLEALRRYDLLGAEPEESFDRITRLAAHLFEVPISLVTFVDEDRQWFKSAVGLEGVGVEKKEMGLAASFCVHTIQSKGATVVQDATEDERFSSNPFVIGEPGIRFYAGAPLVTPDGYRIGTLCVLDTEPRAPTSEAISRLEDLAEMAMGELKLRREVEERRKAESRLHIFSEAIEQTHDGIVISEAEPPPEIIYANAAVEESHGYSKDEILGQTPQIFEGPETDPQARASLQEALQAGEPWIGEMTSYRKDGSTFLAQVSISPIRDETGEIEYWVSIERDVTEEREREAALRDRKAQLKGLANSIPGVVYQFFARSNDTYGFHFVSEHAEPLLGISPDPDTFYDRFVEHVPSSHRDELIASIDEAVEKEESWRFEMPFEKPSGERIWLLGTSTPERRKEELVFNGVILDITERKHAEQALREERDRFVTLFESLPTPALHGRADEDGSIRIQAINNAFEDVFGTSSSVAEGKDVYEFLVPNDEQEIAAERVRCAFEQGSLQVEIRRETPDGPRDFQLQAAVRKEAGRPEGYAIYTDITERRKREERLQRTTAQLEALFEASPDMINVHDTEGNFVAVNPRLCEKTGYDEAELMGMKVWDIEQVVDSEEMRALWTEMEIGDTRKLEGVHRCKDGSTFPVEVHLRRFGLEGEDRFMAITRDISGRLTRKEELRQKERRYEAIFEDPNILVGLTDTDGTVLDINQTAMSYVDASLKELTGMPFWETPWFAGDERLQEDVRQWVRQTADGEYVEFEADLSKAVGEKLVISGVFRPVTNEQGEVTSLLVSDRDVTGQKEQKRKLREAKEEAEQMNRLKSAFLANMSHEIRTPLTSIIGFAEAIGEEVGMGTEEEEPQGTVPRFARLIEKSGTRLLKTLNGVLNLSKLEAGEMKFSPEPVDLSVEATKEAAELMGPKATAAGINLQVQTGETSTWAWADEGGTRIILRNLVSNAIKYTEEGGRVWVRTRTEDDNAVLEVEDTGIGMDPQRVPELFEPFRQGSEGTCREYEGSGLGLAVTKRIVDRMGGAIEVETEKGEGTRMTVCLPLDECSERQEEPPLPGRDDQSG